MDAKVDAVILSYGRTGNLSQIVASVLSVPWVDQVTLWHNGPSLLHREALGAQNATSGRVVIINCPENKYTWGRFLATRACRHRAIITQDDDVLVRNWDEIMMAWEPEAMVAALRPGHLAIDNRFHWREAHEVLLGWGAMFDRAMVPLVFEPYIAQYGHDKVLHRKADRIFGILHDQRHTTIEAKFLELPGANVDGLALYTLPDHTSLTHEARRRALGLLGIEYVEK